MSRNEISSYSYLSLSEITSDFNDHFQVLNIMNFDRHSLYLIRSRDEKKIYIAKPFKRSKDSKNKLFENLMRFNDLLHPNIVSIASIEHSISIDMPGSNKVFDLAFMEPVKYDFKSMITDGSYNEDHKLVRTFCHHLLSGLEYLHFKGIAHLDLKLENLGLNDEYQLKILHFDMAYKQGDKTLISKGAQNYRAPELWDGDCHNPFAADLYSLGVLIFVMNYDFYPFLEGAYGEETTTYELLCNAPDKYWALWEKQIGKVDKDFKSLIQKLLNQDPEKRGKASDLREDPWFMKPIYIDMKLIEVMQDSKYNTEDFAFY